jgi:hypothetical protein
VWNSNRKTVELLIKMVDVFERSFVRDARSKPKNNKPLRVPAISRAPSGESALPQLAAHGFVNLPAEVITALRASQADGGGDLRWLGTADHGTPDFMHFELKVRPPLF